MLCGTDILRPLPQISFRKSSNAPVIVSCGQCFIQETGMTYSNVSPRALYQRTGALTHFTLRSLCMMWFLHKSATSVSSLGLTFSHVLSACSSILRGLCSVCVARTVLVTHGCLGYRWAVLQSIKAVFSHPRPQRSLGWGGQGAGRGCKTADPKWPKGSSMPCDAMLSNKSQERERKRGGRVLSCNATTAHGEAFLPRESLNITC